MGITKTKLIVGETYTAKHLNNYSRLYFLSERELTCIESIKGIDGARFNVIDRMEIVRKIFLDNKDIAYIFKNHNTTYALKMFL